MKLTYTVSKNNTYENIKQILKCEFHMSDKLILKLKKQNKIFLNSTLAKTWNLIQVNDIIDIYIDFIEDSSNIVPFNMDLKILYEDEAYLIIDKPAGLPVHPSLNYYSNSLSNGVKYYFDSIRII